ncbi:MAG: tripartite tricarboxylate transporter substrate binding protein [Clostridia bacterium]|nr:tripartite tricarboxylate transporter substrate binding protein [Clostridia bacterium]
MKNKGLLSIIPFILVLAMLMFAFTGCTTTDVEEEGEWEPSEAINVVIQYAAGGGTDLTLRMLAAQMEKELGTSLVSVNMPGATGAVATDFVYRERRDGLTWLGAATNDVMHYPVMGLHPTTYEDWEMYIATLSTSIVAVSADSEYETFDDLLKDFRDRPGEVKVATAGIGASAHVAAEILNLGSGIEYSHVPYDGGYPAIIATIGQETETVFQHAMEVSDMLKAGELRALAVFDNKPLDMPGYGEIPAITDWLPELDEMLPHGAHFGIALPSDTPENILEAVDKVFLKAVESQEMKDFAVDRGIDLVGLSRGDARDWIAIQAPVVTWILYEGGLAENNPEDFGFEKPW